MEVSSIIVKNVARNVELLISWYGTLDPNMTCYIKKYVRLKHPVEYEKEFIDESAPYNNPENVSANFSLLGHMLISHRENKSKIFM